MPKRSPGPSVKDPKQYEALRKQGESKDSGEPGHSGRMHLGLPAAQSQGGAGYFSSISTNTTSSLPGLITSCSTPALRK